MTITGMHGINADMSSTSPIVEKCDILHVSKG